MTASNPLKTTLKTVRAKGAKFAAVSVLATLVSQAFLFIFVKVFSAVWPQQPSLAWGVSNVIAVTLGAIPSFHLSRRWVWGQQKGGVSFKKEVVPFWGFSFLGLVASTASVVIVSKITDVTLAANLANIAAFMSLWVIKLVVFEKRVFVHPHRHSPPA